MSKHLVLGVVVAVTTMATWSAESAVAGGYRGRGGGHGSPQRNADSGSSHATYSNPYLNPYSYESQALPYWLKSDYRSGSRTSYCEGGSRSDRFGAIAYSRSTGTYGYSYNHFSQADAEQDALSRCDAADRAIIGWMRNAHGALAVGDDAEHYGWAWGATRDEAQQAALAHCRERTSNCRIAVSVFSGN